MNNSNDLTSSILQSSESSIPDIMSSSSDGDGMFESIKDISTTTWLLIILILAFLGFNIFVYLAKGTQEISDVVGPFVEKILGLFGIVTGQVVDVSAEGAKAVVGTTAEVVNTGLTTVQEITPNKANSSISTVPVSQQNPVDIMAQNTLNKAINSAQSKETNNNDYEADEASSNIQSGTPKPGWCYVGEDRGFRTCAQVGINDKCMSGDIFPSQELCINPNLRA
jgi:hypothetical protein